MAGKRTCDDKGVSSVMELIFTFIIASLIFSLLIMNLNGLLLDTPKYVVTQNQYADVGNGVSTMIIDTYLVVPENGAMITHFTIPDNVVGDNYNVSVENVTGTDDREVRVSSLEGRNISVSVTLNGASLTIPINGTTHSYDADHSIKYTPK